MSTDPGQAEVPSPTTPSPSEATGAANAGAAAPPHPTFSNITLTFPIVFLSNLPRQSSSDNNGSSDDDAQNILASEEVQNLFTRFLQAMPSMPFPRAIRAGSKWPTEETCNSIRIGFA